MSIISVMALSLLQTTLCSAASPAASAVREVADGIIAADNARDIDKVRNFYAANAVLLPPNAEPSGDSTGHTKHCSPP